MNVVRETASVHHRSRPMLVRAADAIYWMSRYMERAEAVARLLSVHAGLLIDVGELPSHAEQALWRGVLATMRIDNVPSGPAPLPQRVMRFVTFDPQSPMSLTSCLTRARENARAVRERISAEMWESLNRLYWFIHDQDASRRFDESPEDLWREIITGSMLFQGLCDQTIAHDQRWHFTQTAKYLERVDYTCRAIQTRLALLTPAEHQVESPLRSLHWSAVLRSCCSIEAFRQNHGTGFDPLAVVSFLVLDGGFPRSVLFSVMRAREAVTAVAAETGHAMTAQRILGRLEATLRYAQPAEIAHQGIASYMQGLQSQVAEAGADLQDTYFLY
jgi:uncharacterized alpha-E superfamily protein